MTFSEFLGFLKTISIETFGASENYLAGRHKWPDPVPPKDQPCESLRDLAREVKTLSCRVFAAADAYLASLQESEGEKNL